MQPSIRSVLIQLPILLLAACASTGESQTPPPQNEPGVVQGVALDAQGKPLAGVKIWVRPSVTTGLLQATTDAQGRYRVKGPSNLPYNAYAWHTFTYRGKKLCLRLASQDPTDYESFVPERGVVRNFRLQMQGEIPDYSNNFFGGELRLFVPATPEGSKLTFTLIPDGPLVDGSVGKTLNFTISEILLKGIPLGVYKASAAFVDASGNKTPLELSLDGFNGFGPQATVQWESKDGCVGSSGSGPDRFFLWIRGLE